jgi:hypothetical protein
VVDHELGLTALHALLLCVPQREGYDSLVRNLLDCKTLHNTPIASLVTLPSSPPKLANQVGELGETNPKIYSKPQNLL